MLQEDPADINATLAARTAALSSIVSLGPPDLCCVTKSFDKKSSKGLGGLLGGAGAADVEPLPPRGFCHHVIGLDVSSPAPVASYVADLAATQEPAGWLAAGAWRVSGAVYACWDAFGRADLRGRGSIPGGVEASVVRPDGRGGAAEAPLDADTWRRVSLSALLRCDSAASDRRSSLCADESAAETSSTSL